MIDLELKVRKRGDTLRMSMQNVRAWMELPEEFAKQRLYEFFDPLKDDKPDHHDYLFIQQVIDWVPVDDRSGRALGLPLKIQVRLINLTNQLMPFDDAKDPQPGIVKLSTKDVELLWERMNDDKFLVGPVSPPYAAFLYDFQMATKKHFEYLEDELKDKPEPEEAKGKENERELERAEIPTDG
jgi:hypothetical protein